METIRIYAKKAFAIGPGAQRGTSDIDSFITVPGAFQELPAKYQDDPTYRLAVSAGDIVVVDGKADEAELAGAPTGAEPPAQTEEEAFAAALKYLKSDKVNDLAEQYGVTIEDGDDLQGIKAKILTAYKAAHEV